MNVVYFKYTSLKSLSLWVICLNWHVDAHKKRLMGETCMFIVFFTNDISKNIDLFFFVESLTNMELIVQNI